MSTVGPWCEVEEILDERVKRNKIEYLVKWKRSDDDGDSDDEAETEWVPRDLCSCPFAIAKYYRSIGRWQEIYEVEGIIDSIEDPDGNMEYLVKWKDFDSATDSTWVKEDDMDCNHLIQQFEDGHPYRDENILLVDRIDGFVGFSHGVDNYTIVEEGSEVPTDKIYTFDELYIAANGRKALNDFKGEFC